MPLTANSLGRLGSPVARAELFAPTQAHLVGQQRIGGRVDADEHTPMGGIAPTGGHVDLLRFDVQRPCAARYRRGLNGRPQRPRHAAPTPPSLHAEVPEFGHAAVRGARLGWNEDRPTHARVPHEGGEDTPAGRVDTPRPIRGVIARQRVIVFDEGGRDGDFLKARADRRGGIAGTDERRSTRNAVEMRA